MANAAETKRGAALIVVIGLTAVVAIGLGAIFGYVSNATRQAALAVGRDVCRLAAQSGIEIVKTEVNAAFQRTISASARIIGAMIGGTESTSAFDWFESYSGTTPKTTIGRSNTVNVGGDRTICGCTVRVGIGRVQHAVGEQFAVVTFVAEAVRSNPGGTVSRSVIAETVRFAQERSKVFDNAYFVNNYGWFQGSGCTANGDVRANGDMYLDSSCKVNGRVYAAKNDELGVEGNVTNYGKMDNYSTYRSTTYGTSNMARPLANDPVAGTKNSGGYDAPSSVSTQNLKDRIKANQPLTVEMPYIGDISSAESEYRDWAQQLHNKDAAMSTIKQDGQTLVSVFYDGAGPSGLATMTDSYGNEVTAPDYGAIVLTGTAEHPIEVNGPVIIPSDVIISGYVKGQGTIYSGRNIHIVGNIQYVNPPSWSGKSTSGGSNATKDMLGLMAKGNIVMGNYTDSTWLSSINTYLTQQPYVQQYACDTSDAAIGYPETFGGSYAAKEYVSNTDYGKCASAGLTDFVPGGYDASTGGFGKLVERTVELSTGHYENIGWGRTKWVPDTTTEREFQYNRKYYESVCADSEISSRCSTITRIDAVLYNNHGIFGKLGQCSINGSLVCRNEGLQYSGKLFLNWDIRLYSGSSETVDNERVGLAKGSGNPPRTIGWMELPESFVAFEAAAVGEGGN